MRGKLRTLGVFLILVFIAGCGTPQRRDEGMDINVKDAKEVASAIRDRFMDLDAVRELRDAGLEGAEFVYEVFRKAGKSVPRTTGDLAKYGRKMRREETRVGDLVFFKTGFFKKHVGVYIGMNRFVHSTSDEGVMISNFKDPYWKKTFWQTRRILDF